MRRRHKELKQAVYRKKDPYKRKVDPFTAITMEDDIMNDPLASKLQRSSKTNAMFFRKVNQLRRAFQMEQGQVSKEEKAERAMLGLEKGMKVIIDLR